MYSLGIKYLWKFCINIVCLSFIRSERPVGELAEGSLTVYTSCDGVVCYCVVDEERSMVLLHDV